MKNKNRLFLTIDESNAIKGVLIILIVLGHNHILSPNTEEGGIMEYLYMFHVQSFFILPFFYDKTVELNSNTIKNIIFRNWWPYLWICMLCYISYNMFSHQWDMSAKHIWAFLQGTQTRIKNCFGFVFPWFLPTYCSFYIGFLLAKKNKWVYCLLFIASLVTWSLQWHQFYWFKNTIPLGMGLAINYFASGAIAFYLNKWWEGSKYAGAVVFITLSVCWWNGHIPPYTHNLFPASFFLTIMCICKHIQWEWLKTTGKYSLCIYLFHVFIVNAVCMACPNNVWGGILSFVASLTITMGMASMISHNKTAQTLLFAKSPEQLLKIFLKTHEGHKTKQL